VKTLYAAKSISVGDHHHFSLFGLTIDSDILMSTVLALIIIIFMGWRLRKTVTDGVPGKFQLIWEILVVDIVGDLATSAMGEKGKKFIPLGVTVFIFVLVCNWIGFLPTAMHPGQSGEIFPAPTSDVNLPLALALFVIVWVHIESLRERRIGGYFKHFAQPFAALTPMNLIEEATKPITLTLRLFGNLFSGGLMIVVVAALMAKAIGPFEIIWKPFDLAIGAIQAYIFMLLTIIYLDMATSHEQGHEAKHEKKKEKKRNAVLETSQ
jgi:F-type H+-transporting ATPase subunit a